jgi:hypothetical protein
MFSLVAEEHGERLAGYTVKGKEAQRLSVSATAV